MSSNGFLYGAQVPSTPANGIGLDQVPLKLDMTDPANQAKGANAWSALRARMGNPLPALDGVAPGSDADKKYQAEMNMAQITSLLHKRYLGMPDADIYNRITSDEGLQPGQAALHEIDSPAQAPIAMQPNIHSKSAATFVRRDPTTNLNRPYIPGGPAQSDTYITNDIPSMFKAGVLAHEAVHPWANANFRSFDVAPGQDDISKYNSLGEEPSPHFPGGYHDRRMLDSLKADQLATAYGGYPAGWQKQSPWPMVKK